jgi:hypothetical protein
VQGLQHRYTTVAAPCTSSTICAQLFLRTIYCCIICCLLCIFLVPNTLLIPIILVPTSLQSHSPSVCAIACAGPATRAEAQLLQQARVVTTPSSAANWLCHACKRSNRTVHVSIFPAQFKKAGKASIAHRHTDRASCKLSQQILRGSSLPVRLSKVCRVSVQSCADKARHLKYNGGHKGLVELQQDTIQLISSQQTMQQLCVQHAATL